MSHKAFSAPIVFFLIVCALGPMIGCQPREEITSYTVPRERSLRPPVSQAELANQMDHILVAILPAGDQAWFFKMTGKAPALNRQRGEFSKFLATLKAGSSANAIPSWQLPTGWKEEEASEMRVATLVVPDEQGVLEIAVSSLPLTEDWQDFLTRNVNRWLGQLNQSPLDGATINKLTEKISTSAGAATLIELVGFKRQQPPGDPHAGLSMPPVTPGASQQPTSKPLAYDTPDGWQPGRLSAMRKAAFNIVEGERKAEFTVIDLPTAGGAQISDVQANVLRWAGQVGLTDLDDAALGKLVKEITISGVSGSFVALLGPKQEESPTGMLAAMVVHDGKVWFFKMFGDRALVESQQDAFQQFLESVQFQ